MPLLSPEFYQKLGDEHTNRMKQSSVPPTPPTPAPGGGVPAPAPTQSGATAVQEPEKPFRFGKDISEEEQIKKFGGVVGSTEYYDNLQKRQGSALAGRVGGPVAAGAALGSVVPGVGTLAGAGLGALVAGSMPDQEVWDRMGTGEKVATTGFLAVSAPIKLVLGLPAAIGKAIPNLIGFAARPILEGQNPLSKEGVENLAKSEQQKPYRAAGVELDPLYTNIKKSAEDAKALGYNDSVASAYGYFQGGVEILNNALIGHMFAKGMQSFVKVPGKLAPGETIVNKGPIQEAIKSTETKLAVESGKAIKDGSPSIYQSVPNDFAKEVSQSTGKSGKVFYKITPAGEGTVEVALVQARGGPVEYLKNKFGAAESDAVAGKFGKETKIEAHIVKIGEAAEKPAVTRLEPITEPFKGSENRPITRMQVDNLSNIGNYNGIDPAIKDSVVRTITGKSVVGELTNAEYVKVAKVLTSMNKLGEYAPGGEASLYTKYAGQSISPPRSWMEAVQRKTGIPIYDSWLDIENGSRFAKVSQEALQTEARTIFGKLADNSNASIEMRRLVDAHMHGDTAAITQNTTLAPAMKAELLKIVGDVQKFYETHGVDLNVPKDIYRTNEAGFYAPDVADIGGISQRYKGEAFPGGKEFFAKQKKEGGAFVRIDDPLKLMDIYARQGAQAKFLDDALGRAKELHDTQLKPGGFLSGEFGGAFKSAVQEKLGYEGGFTRVLDDVSARMRNLPGMEKLPPDLGRKLNQGVFSYMYVNALNSPATWLRNEITNNTILYARLGPEFWGKAKMKALTPEGMAEVRSKGFLTDSNNPYGADIGTAEGAIKTVTEKVLAPQGMADSLGRATAYFQSKMIFEDALSKYNSGKLTWEQAQAKMNLDAMSPIEAQRVRQNLVSGNTEAAFQEYARSIIDETNFPYRRGSSARVTYGTGGKVATFLYKWNIEFGHTMGRWLRTGQVSNIVRYYTASAAMVKSFQSQGLDFSKSVFAGPVSAKYPPIVQMGIDFLGTLQAQTGDNAQAIDDSHEALAKSLKTFLYPGGVDAKNLQDFWRAYNAGPDKDGLYQPLNPNGSTAGNPVPFHDIWARLFGLPTQSKVDFGETKREANNYMYERSKAIQKVAELRNSGKDEEADEIVLEWESRGENIEPGKQSYDRFDVPEGERIFKRLGPTGKELFGEELLR